MTYQQAVKKINSLLRFGMKPGLERIASLLERMGNPQDKLKVVHVAGTNGKGTTCTLIASVLAQAGYRTGLFTSPYVTEFRERFQINGEMISEQELVDFLEELVPIAEEMAKQGEIITEFELITALAFLWFERRGCDIVVLEVGLGGRFDATNVIECPLVSVITSISLDHTAILGDTIEKIAFEKAGIIKQGGITVSYPQQESSAQRILQEVAKQKENEFVFAQETILQPIAQEIDGSKFLYDEIELFLPFVGEHQRKNAATALTALQVLQKKGFTIPDASIQQGFARAYIPARMEVLSHYPMVLLDGGHNPEGAQALEKVITKYLPDQKIIAIMGMMSDKDSRRALSYLAPHCSEIITLQPENPRSLTSEQLADVAKEFCPAVQAMHDRKRAFLTALEHAGKDGAIIICGSFFLAGEMRPIAAEILQHSQN